MIDITTTRIMATQMLPPTIIFAMLFLTALATSLLASYDWNGDDLQGRGLYLDMAPWQTAVFSLQKLAQRARP